MKTAFKIGGAVAKTTLSIAECFVNPLHIGSAVSSFVHMLNLIYSTSKPASYNVAANGNFHDGGSVDVTDDWDDGGIGDFS